MLRSEESGILVNTFLHVNETEVILSPQDGLEDDQKYVYTVIAINTVGMAITNRNITCNLSLQFTNYKII